MTEKLYEYEGFLGVLHGWRDNIRERWQNWKENNPHGFVGYLKSRLQETHKSSQSGNVVYEDYSHIYRKKTRKELVRVSAAVMGIEFSYAAETAFVTPTLLKIGVEHQHMTLVWALSPLFGFFLTPILGSLSDRCSLRLGRRRPFIICMSIGVFLGLILIPNGERMGYAMGDKTPEITTFDKTVASHRTTGQKEYSNDTTTSNPAGSDHANYHPWGVFFTVLGTVLLDFDADACQSPARAYLLDVTVSDDHARGLSTFTVMAGLGGFFGYALGGINWDITTIGILLGGHVRAVFTLITIIFIICVSYTISSFKEMPLHLLEQRGDMEWPDEDIGKNFPPKKASAEVIPDCKYGSLDTQKNDMEQQHAGTPIEPECSNLKSGSFSNPRTSIIPTPDASFLIYLKSIVYMPRSIKILCLTNLFCWMAHVCYSLYFTDFVGEAVFGGNPTAPIDTPSRDLYEEGVRFGCWGMSMYSLSCSCYSLIIERLIHKFGAKRVYVGGLLVYSSGMFLMAVTKHKVGVIVFSWTAGVMYSTLFTMPYLLIAHYHATGMFAIAENGGAKTAGQIRGLGTDVAIVSSMVFLAQFILSLCMGSIVTLSGTTAAVAVVASTLAFCGAVAATQVLYLDL